MDASHGAAEHESGSHEVGGALPVLLGQGLESTRREPRHYLITNVVSEPHPSQQRAVLKHRRPPNVRDRVTAVQIEVRQQRACQGHGNDRRVLDEAIGQVEAAQQGAAACHRLDSHVGDLFAGAELQRYERRTALSNDNERAVVAGSATVLSTARDV
eukprot:scaffold58788_cov66-Phaeocystis_antarctica.AAC.4